MTVAFMKLNKIINFILCFMFRITSPIEFIEISIPLSANI